MVNAMKSRDRKSLDTREREDFSQETIVDLILKRTERQLCENLEVQPTVPLELGKLLNKVSQQETQ